MEANELNPTWAEMKQAGDFLERYMKSNGEQFPSELPLEEDDIPPYWSDEAKRAREIYLSFQSGLSEDGVIA